MPAPVPDDVARRLDPARCDRSLGTTTEGAFGTIARLPPRARRSPTVSIPSVDEARRWLGPEIGLGVREASLGVSPRARAMHQPGLFLVPEAHRDRRCDGPGPNPSRPRGGS